jgi:hypothetical protein
VRRDPDRGTSLVEVGLILPVLIVLAIGLSEIGFLVVDYLTVSNAAREGARTGAAAADFDQGGVDADDLILEAVEEAACNLRFGTLEKVLIFKADAAGEPTIGSINEYSPSGALNCNSPLNALACDNLCPWAPSSRNRVPNVAIDVLGVEVTFSHSSVTGHFPFLSADWTEAAVMQIEPDTKGTQ